MEFHRCASSEIESFGYDRENRVLGLKFIRGGVYTYAEFPEDMFKRFLAASSKGSFFHRFVKGKFEMTAPVKL